MAGRTSRATIRLPSAGVYQRNADHNGMSVTTSINAETGIIVTGDDSVGVGNVNWAGDSIAINEGSITSGDGVVGQLQRVRRIIRPGVRDHRVDVE